MKRLANILFLILVSPIVLLYQCTRRLRPKTPDIAFQGYSQFLSLIPGTLGVFCRRAFYHLTLENTSLDCSIGFGTIIATPSAQIGPGTFTGAFCNIGDATLERDILIGSNVTILSGKNQHRFDRLDIPIRYQGGEFRRVTISQDVWIGNCAVVMADVGEHSVVAAGSVVVKAVPAFAIVAGNPARVVGSRLQNTSHAGELPRVVDDA